ncbi:hypothetical protein LAG90_08865 [Marinilongibacter aquaticus]|uniref:glycosyl hydrolase n=1 Tax=Marinilongibacter aquaticus TaxID=2975157 RepID=UPI0021BD22D1|nr:glycosyl hydrolase [Marinilongibacter aquaticus]UBM60744.1 hypothetical protein LAG90_08865 [Marinilongibacter aquaticus]
MKRRNFVKTSLLGTSGIFFIDSILGCTNPILEEKSKESLEEIYAGFQNPPAQSRLFVRWWWNGNRLSEKEILRELDVMKAAGIGGVEINPIAFAGDTDPVGYEALTIFTDEWLAMLEVALKGAKARGIICDMIVGSGWPFGGEFLKKDEQTQMVTIGTVDLDGGKNYTLNIEELLDEVNPPIHSKNKVVYKDIVMARLLPKEANTFMEGTDLMNRIEGNSLSIEVPSGSYVLYYVVKLTGFMAVINGAPGAAGPVLNHYSKPATEAYLNRVSGFINGKMGHMGDYIRAMFCDSMELEGANWVDDLPDEFEKRRGYALWPYLPFVLKKVGHMGNPLDEAYGTTFPQTVVDKIKRVDLDYYQTRIELFKERFIDTFNDWCHTQGVQSRMQAYGRGMHPLEASMSIDIPECETWLSKDVGREFPNIGSTGRAPRMCNKYVASGANLAGKQIISCEEVTNTSMVFMATLENIKIVGDQSNISGVNHSILHGFNYSPPEAIFPGWVRYGTYFNEQNTWWPYFKNWADYKARLSFLLQKAVPQANVGILQPLTDLWLKYGPQRDPFPQHVYPDYQDNLWEAVHQNGGACDYVSENIIKNATFKKGEMRYNNRSYDTLLLPGIETLDIETTEALKKFAESGGKVVCIGKRPVQSPAYAERQASDEAVKKLTDELLESENAFLYPAPTDDIIAWYGEMQEDLELKPFVKFEQTHKYLNQASYRIGEHEVFFIANTSLSEHISVKAEFQVNENHHPWIWNLETGEKQVYSSLGKTQSLQLELPKATSVLIVFEPTAEGSEFEPIAQSQTGQNLNGPWHLTCKHIDGHAFELELPALSNLGEHKQMENFAGEVLYTLHFDQNESAQFSCIDLGDVQGISELSLNGKHLGTKWYGAQLFDIGEAIQAGENKLEIKLTTIIGNYVKSLKDNRVAQNWTHYQENYPMGILGPVRLV